MLIDSGADVTLLPQAAVAALDILPLEGEEYALAGFDGTITHASAVRLDVIFAGRVFRGRFLLSDQGWGILGRNLLNAISLLLDGPALTWQVTEPSAGTE